MCSCSNHTSVNSLLGHATYTNESWNKDMQSLFSEHNTCQLSLQINTVTSESLQTRSTGIFLSNPPVQTCKCVLESEAAEAIQCKTWKHHCWHVTLTLSQHTEFPAYVFRELYFTARHSVTNNQFKILSRLQLIWDNVRSYHE